MVTPPRPLRRSPKRWSLVRIFVGTSAKGKRACTKGPIIEIRALKPYIRKSKPKKTIEEKPLRNKRVFLFLGGRS